MMHFSQTFIIYSIITICTTFALAFFFSRFLTPKFQKKSVYYGLYIFYFCANLSLTLFVGDIWVRGIFGIVFPFAASLIFYTGKMIRKIFFAELVLVFHLSTEPLVTVFISWMTGYVFPEVPAEDTMYFIAAGLSTLIYLLAIIVVTYRSKPDKAAMTSRMYALLCLMIGMCLFMSFGNLLIILQSGIQITFFHVVLTLSIYTMPIFIFYVFKRFQEHAYMQTHSNMLRLQLVQNARQFELMESSQTEIRKLKHDFSGQIMTMKAMTERSSNPELLEYLENFSNSANRTLEKTFTGLLSVDTVIDTKKIQAEQLGINFEIKTHVIPEIEINPVCLNNILLNALDNAIEACALLPGDMEKHVELGLKGEGEHLFIRIVNTSLPVLINDGIFPQTTKDDKSAHGIGLESIADSVEQNDGIMTIDYEDDRFILLIRLRNMRFEEKP